MIKDNQRLFNRLHFILDAIVVAISYSLAVAIRFMTPINDPLVYHLPYDVYFMAIPFLVIGYLFLYYQFDLYSSKRVSGRKRELYNIIKANVTGLIAFIVVLYIIHQPHFARSLIFIFFALNVFMCTAERNVIRLILRYFRKKGFNRKYILLVGYSESAENYIRRIIRNPQWGYVIRGILDDNVKAGTTFKGVKVLGRIGNLDYILPENKLDEIAITLDLSEYGKLERIVALCEKSGVHTQFVPDYNRVIPSRPYMEDLDGLPVINIRHVPLTNPLNIFIKRVFDIVCAILMMIVFSPIMLASAIAVKLSSPGPVIFKQTRVGLHNKEFKMYKFRTMVVQKKEDEKNSWTTPEDPRVTGVGKVLRGTSMDELPQLFNVLKGEMSIVGPRPERPQFVEKFKEEIPRYMVKHQVRPGLTGWAQVNGYRGDTSILKRVEFDLYYIENWTFSFD
ncbi:MAG: undecaprenyl-phosphate glucose phosphotransferase, partial [Lachnospiraceae bacterium]|nr:undecaprenyl-phosphate glucose phosphotransferase [Lachnospiraceae bacterium]